MARLVIEFDLDRPDTTDPNEWSLMDEVTSHLSEYIAGTWGPDTHDGYEGPYVSNVVVLAETKKDGHMGDVNFWVVRGRELWPEYSLDNAKRRAKTMVESNEDGSDLPAFIFGRTDTGVTGMVYEATVRVVSLDEWED